MMADSSALENPVSDFLLLFAATPRLIMAYYFLEINADGLPQESSCAELVPRHLPR